MNVKDLDGLEMPIQSRSRSCHNLIQNENRQTRDAAKTHVISEEHGAVG
jgi:hypothetical protein